MFLRILFCILVFQMGVYANAQYSLSGKIENTAGEPLPSAHVYLTGTQIVTASNARGQYVIKNLKAGDYTIEVSFIGYERWTQNIRIKDNYKLDIVMNESSLLASEVIVRANRANVNDPVAYTNIDRDRLEDSDRMRDIPYLLELTPSVVTTSDPGTGVGYSGLRIRGTDPSRINVSINGIPYNDSESHDVYWVNIPDFVSSVENIQVQRGVGTSTQGAAAFGANINFQSKSVSPEPFAQIQSGGGSFNTWKNAVSAGTGLINDHISVETRLSRITSDGFIDRAFANLNSYYLSAGWYGAKSILKATTFSGKEVTYQAWGGVPAEMLDTSRTFNPYTYDNEVDDYKQSHYQLHWSYQANRRLNVNAALHYTRGLGFFEQYKVDEDLSDYLLDPVYTENDTVTSSDIIRRKWLDNHFYGGVANASYTTGNVTITTGGGWNRYDGDHYGRVIWAGFASSGDIRHEYYFSNGLKSDWNYFARLNYQLFSRLKLYVDFQYRHIDYLIEGVDDDQRDITQEHKYNFVNPKAGFFFDLPSNNQLYFSYSLGNREPKRSNFTDSRPGEIIKPERLHDFELGHTYHSRIFSTGINIYLMDYKDQLVLTGEINDVGSPIMVNVPDSYRAGIELMLGFQPLKSVKWEANATISRNRIKSFVEYVDDWDTWGQQTIEHQNTSLSFSPELIAGSRFSWTILEGLDLALSSKYVGKQYMDNTSDEARKLDPYFVNNIRISYEFDAKLISRARIYFDLLNMFDEIYESNAWVYSYFYEGNRDAMIGYYPQAGRHFMAGIILDL